MLDPPKFRPLPTQEPEAASHVRLLGELLRAMKTSEGITQPELCARLRCGIRTLQRNLPKAQYLARMFGWDVHARAPTATERCVRLQLRYTDIMPETLERLADPEAP